MNSSSSNDIADIKSELVQIKQNMQQLLTICNRMNNHISFIEQVYMIVQLPFKKIMSYFTKDQPNLPVLYETNSNGKTIGIAPHTPDAK